MKGRERKGVRQTENQIGVYSPAEKSTVHPNEITDLMEVVERVPKLMAMWLTKLLKRPTNPRKVKITGKRVSKSVGMVWSYLPCEQWFLPPDATLRKGSLPFVA